MRLLSASKRRLALALCAVAGLSGCGGGENGPAPGSAERPLAARAPETAASSSDSRKAGAADLSKLEERAGYKALLDRQARRPKRTFSPCNLVTPDQAQAIFGSRISAPVEAPQGPTCIYRTNAGDRFVTVAVQRGELAGLKPQLRGARKLDVAGRPAFCGQVGQPTVYLPLRSTRVLSVTGPCAIAARFAATAARRLSD